MKAGDLVWCTGVEGECKVNFVTSEYLGQKIARGNVLHLTHLSTGERFSMPADECERVGQASRVRYGVGS